MSSPSDLLAWQEEAKCQVWYDSKTGQWIAFMHRNGVVIQPSKPTLVEVLSEAMYQWCERNKNLTCLK